MTSHRISQSWINHWWKTVDRPILISLFILTVIGMMMVTTASPAVAERIGLTGFYFVSRQAIFLSLGFLLMLVISLLPPVVLRRLAMLGFTIGLVLMILVLFVGAEAKGAKRWLYISGFSIQPSEFVKPLFAVVSAWVLSQRQLVAGFPGFKLAIGLYATFAGLLLLQPDVGMTLVVSAVWGVQVFLAGLPLMWVLLILCVGVIGALGAYEFFPHVQRRVELFLSPDQTANYQVTKSMEAFTKGGFTGVGPGEGVVKLHLPDSHTDFIFAVVGEELGAIACLALIAIFAFVVLRGLIRLVGESDLFVVYAVAGLLMQFCFQSFINMGVSLHLLPTKGMTLPFISYGGSSLLAIALGMGMILALTRKRYGMVKKQWVDGGSIV